MGHTTGEPYWANTDFQKLFMTSLEPYNVSAVYERAKIWNQFKLGQTDVSEHLESNRWTLVKIHYDTSGKHNSQGIYEAWLKPMDGSWTKVADWKGGMTPDFSWPLDKAGGYGGHGMFRMPTTVDKFDSWIYLDDFAMASSEEGLPRY